MAQEIEKVKEMKTGIKVQGKQWEEVKVEGSLNCPDCFTLMIAIAPFYKIIEPLAYCPKCKKYWRLK